MIQYHGEILLNFLKPDKLNIFCINSLNYIYGKSTFRASVIIYYHMSIPSGIDLDHCSMHPTITEIEKTISV